MIAIAGVTGRTGRQVANSLLAAGSRIRVIVRETSQGAEWKERGAEVAVADLNDAAALTAALRGADGAYLLNAPARSVTDVVAGATEAAKVLRTAIESSGVKHVVFLSSVAAHQAAGTGPIIGLHVIENALRDVKTPITWLRAAYFLENLDPSSKDLVSMLSADVPVEMIATADIAAFAVAALQRGPAAEGVVEVSGPAPTSMRQLAADTGRRLIEVPTAQRESSMVQFGLPVHAARAYVEMYAGLESGQVRFEGEPRRGVVTAAQFMG